MSSVSFLPKIVNIGLRSLSLGSKLVLTLYMGRYLGLAEMGVYGLVFGAVAISCVVLGGRLDFVVARDLVGRQGIAALFRMRDQAVLYGLHYALFTLIVFFLYFLKIAPPYILLSIYALSILENLANMISTNMIALGQPTLSTLLFFIRAGLWCLVVTAIGIAFPATRTVENILIAWIIGSSASLFLALYAWRHLPWRDVWRLPIDWEQLFLDVKQSFPIWLGALGGMGSLYIDRFVASFFLDMDQVGVITFFTSFSMALLALVQSGFFAFSFPRLIQHHKDGHAHSFWKEAKQTIWQVALFVFLAACGVGVGVPYLGDFLGKPMITEAASTLWLLLVAVWIKGLADSLYYVLYARHQDWANWVGDLLFLVPSLIGNMILIPLCGLPGVGYSSILAAVFLLSWRIYFVKNPTKEKNSRK